MELSFHLFGGGEVGVGVWGCCKDLMSQQGCRQEQAERTSQAGDLKKA